MKFKGMSINSVIFDEKYNFTRQFLNNLIGKRVRIKMDVRQRRIYKDGCKATRFEWCNAQGNYIPIKTMDASYLKNVVQFLREVAEAKIEDSKKVLTHHFLVNEHDRVISKMTIDTYCYQHFICWVELRLRLQIKREWVDNRTQVANINYGAGTIPTQEKLSYDNETLRPGAGARIDDIGTGTLTKTDRDIEYIHSQISDIKGYQYSTDKRIETLNSVVREVKTLVSQDRSSNLKSYVETYDKIDRLITITGEALTVINNLTKRIDAITNMSAKESARTKPRENY